MLIVNETIKTGSSIIRNSECLVYDSNRSCILCNYGRFIQNKTCVSECSEQYISYFKVCYPCIDICSTNSIKFRSDCLKCKMKNLMQVTYMTFPAVFKNRSIGYLNDFNDQNIHNFFIELNLFVPDFYLINNNLEYMLFSLLPFQLTINNGLVKIIYNNITMVQANNASIELTRLSLTFNKWNYFIFEQNKNNNVINIYLNSNRLQLNNNGIILTSLLLNDLLYNYNYCLVYIKNLRIWGQYSNLNIIKFYQNVYL